MAARKAPEVTVKLIPVSPEEKARRLKAYMEIVIRVWLRKQQRDTGAA